MRRPALIRIDRVNRRNIGCHVLRAAMLHTLDCKLMAKRGSAKLFLPQCTAHAQYRSAMLDREAGSEHGPARACAQ